jgi:hypothetical protein
VPKNGGGGSAKPEPKPLKFGGGPEPLGPIEVYAYELLPIDGIKGTYRLLASLDMLFFSQMCEQSASKFYK